MCADRALRSPGAAIARRASRENSVERALGGAWEGFVDTVYELAATAYEQDALVASAGDPFVYSTVMARWRAAVRELAENRADLTEAGVILTLDRSDLPLRLYEAARDVLLSARVNGWSTWWTKVQLGRALIPKQADGQRRSLYRATISRTARTAATWSTAVQIAREIELEGYTAQRWVAVGDARTRPAHLRANGQTVPLGAPFEVDGYYLREPGDPSAPPHLVENCRCVVVAADL